MTNAAEQIASLDHEQLVRLSEIASPDTVVGQLVDAELANRGLTREQV